MTSEENCVFIRLLRMSLVFAAIFIGVIQSGALRWQHCIIPIILLCTAAFLNKTKRSDIITDILLFVSLISCVFSVLFTKSDMQDAIHEALKFLCFVSAVYAAVTLRRENIYFMISAAGVLISFVGILSYCNIIRAAEFVFNDRGILRLQSFIRYANVSAVILGCSYFSLCGLNIKSRKLAGALKMLVLSAFFLTVSKAAIPIFLVVGIMYMAKVRDADFTVHNAVSFVFVVPAILLVKNHMYAQCLLLVMLWIASGTYLSGRLVYRKRLTLLWISGACVAAAAAVFLMISGEYDVFSTFTYRLKYMEDALKLVFGGVFGNGPGSWQLMQYGVQQEQYTVTYIHNGWLQFLVENGILFFGAFLTFTVISAYRMIKAEMWHALAALVFISLHSIVDINFGFAAVLIIMGFLCGSAAGHGKLRIPSAIILAICVLASCYGTAEYFVRYSFEKSYIRNDNDAALSYAYKLEKLCPGDSTVQLNIATLSAKNVKGRMERAMELSPYNTDYAVRYAQYKISYGEKDVTEVLERIISMAPMQEDTYTTVKQLAQQAYSYEIITEKELEEFIQKTDSVMDSRGVVDRNRLLEDISGNN